MIWDEEILHSHDQLFIDKISTVSAFVSGRILNLDPIIHLVKW